MPNRFVPNEQRAFEVFSVLEDLWKNSVGIFSNIVLPEDRMLPMLIPDIKASCKEEVARILFAAAIFMRGGIVSEDPLKMFPYLWNNHSEMFDPHRVARQWSPQRIEEVIRQASAQSFSGPILSQPRQNESLHLFEEDCLDEFPQKKKNRRRTSTDAKKIYKCDEFARGWHTNFKMVSDKWNGRVLDMFGGVEDFEHFFGLVGKDIFGMRRKILSLFTIWLQEFGLIPVFPCPVPVDFHALRILFAAGIYGIESFVPRNENYPFHEGKIGVRVSDKMITRLMQWSQNFMVQNGFSHLAINPALWVLSRELCAFNHQNTSSKDGQILVDSHDLTNKGWPKKYSHPCLCCPIEKLCCLSIPAAPYYKWGLLIINGSRVEYPMESLFAGELKKMPLKQRRNNRN